MSKYAFALRAALALSFLTPLAAAQSQARLASAQKAYAEVDYEAARSLAKSALEAGGNDRATTGELYLLWATAAAALDQSEEARSAFQCALAGNPELKLDRSLSPKIRAPYLEARGALVSSDGKAPLDVALQRRGHDLAVVSRDTLHVAGSVVLATREGEAGAFSRQKFEIAPVRVVSRPHDSELQFFLQVLDVHGNVLLEAGTEEQPQRLALVSSAPAPRPRAARLAQSRNPVPYYVSAGVLGAAGLGLGAFATVMYAKREDAAKEWNGPSCEHAGSSRRAQCDAVDDRRKRAEHLSIGLATGGAALVVGAAVTLLVAPSGSRPVNVGVSALPGNVFLSLDTAL